MNARVPARAVATAQPIGSPEERREFIAENLGLAGIHIELAQRYALIGDDHGLNYALRRYAAYSKAALGAFADLKRAAA